MKKKCDVCGNLYKHLERCRDGKFKCKKCKRKEVTNKFYIPPEERNGLDKINKFHISNEEKNVLHKEFKKSYWHIHIDQKILNSIKNKKKKQEQIDKIKSVYKKKNQHDNTQKLIKGLKKYNG